MPGYFVHAFYTAAVYDDNDRPMPAGRLNGIRRYAGTLLFVSTPAQLFGEYDVFHSLSNTAMGPFSKSYELLGRQNEVYAELPDITPTHLWYSQCDRVLDFRIVAIRHLCGYHCPIHQVWAFQTHTGGLDVYIQTLSHRTLGQVPMDDFIHYWVNEVEPVDWWRATHCVYLGVQKIPEWAPRIARPPPMIAHPRL